MSAGGFEDAGKEVLNVFNKLWTTWNLRAVILFSFLLQVLLTFCSPLRKGNSSSWVLMPITAAFLLSDITMKSGMGLFSKIGSDSGGSTNSIDPSIQAFWAFFLLLHFSAPDTITAISFEDITLFLRNLYAIAFHILGVGYLRLVFGTKTTNKMELHIWFIIVVGYSKFMERMFSLMLAIPGISRNILLPKPYHNCGGGSPFNNDEEFELPLVSYNTNSSGSSRSVGLSNLQVLVRGYKLFNNFKGLLVDLIPASSACRNSRDLLLKLTSADAFKIVEVELNFLFDSLYTKAKLWQTKYGCVSKIMSITLTWAALASFYTMDKHKIQKCDIAISYMLLVGAVALEIIQVFMILCSDWAVANLHRLHPLQSPVKEPVRKILLCFLWIRWSEGSRRPIPAAFISRRQSEFINQQNLISFSLFPETHLQRIQRGWYNINKWQSGIRIMGCTDTTEFTAYLGNVIFEELKLKSLAAVNFATAKEIYLSKGEWVLSSEGCHDLRKWIYELEFDKTLLVWHLATNLCFHGGGDTVDDGENLRNVSMILSDYMFYLLNADTTRMMSTLAGIYDVRLVYTCEELDQLFKRRHIETVYPTKKKKGCLSNIFGCYRRGQQVTETNSNHDRVCDVILSEEEDPSANKLSVVSEARKLALELKKLGEREWVVISKVWIELLHHAASRCPGRCHAQAVTMGGELISSVWLLSAHFGLGNQIEDYTS